MSEEKAKKKPPLTINTSEILDPQARWTCQRLDKIYTILIDLITEVREINSTVKTIEQNILQIPKTRDSDFER